MQHETNNFQRALYKLLQIPSWSTPCVQLPIFSQATISQSRTNATWIMTSQCRCQLTSNAVTLAGVSAAASSPLSRKGHVNNVGSSDVCLSCLTLLDGKLKRYVPKSGKTTFERRVIVCVDKSRLKAARIGGVCSLQTKKVQPLNESAH